MIGLGMPLTAVAILWWVSGSDVILTRWISLVVLVLALGGWYLSRRDDNT